MENIIEKLPWDTHFFEKDICRITSEYIDVKNWSHVVEALERDKVELAYYSSVAPLEGQLDSKYYTIKLVDRKTTYKKIIDRTRLRDEAITEYIAEHPMSIMIDLAEQSGEYSRFAVDANFTSNMYRELYKAWIVNSINKTLAKEVLIFKELDVIKGLITLGEKNSIADIGIIAVDSKYRGSGIGKKLVIAAESWFAKNSSHQEIQVVTQGDNIPACKLYENCGYNVSRVEYFYHIWRRTVR